MKRIITFILIISALTVKAQVPLAGEITTIGVSDTYPLLQDTLLRGGYQTVYSKAVRDAIPSARRKQGMMVRVSSLDSTYVLSGGISNANWIPFSSGITASVLSDSLSNYAKIEDGLISGGEATIGTGSVTIDTANFMINKVNYQSLPRTFTGIENSPSGTQYYLVVYGEVGGTLDTISGVRDTIAVIPDNPVNTVKINTILVGDGGVESATPDLTGFAKLIGGNTFFGRQIFNQSIDIKGGYNVTNLLSLDTLYNTKFNLYNPPIKIGIGYFNPSLFVENSIIQTYNSLINSGVNMSLNPFGGNIGIGLNTPAYKLDVDGDINISSGSNYLINGVPLSANPDTTVYRTVANSYSLSSGQAKLNETNFGQFMDLDLATKLTPSSGDFLLGRDIITNEAVEIPFSTVEAPLTFTSPLSRSVNTISIPAATSSVSGHLTSTDWNTFNNKQNTISFGAIGSTPNANGASIASSVITLQPASASFGGVVTTGTQTFGGAKTFSTVQATNFGAGISPNANFGFTGAASTTTTAPFLITPGVTYTGTQNGALWYETTNSRLRMYRNSSVSDIVTTGSNILFGGTSTAPVRAVTATTDGSLAATTPIIAQFITDSDIITALGAATYTNNQATITPAGGKIMLQGQEYWDDTNKIKYQAVANNVVLRTPNRILKTYTALVTQTGTGAPTVTVLGENTIGTIVWTRTAAGQYTGTLTGAFTASKTAVFFQSGISNNVDVYTYDFYRGTDNTVRMLTSNNGVYSDSIFVGQLRIEVYF